MSFQPHPSHAYMKSGADLYCLRCAAEGSELAKECISPVVVQHEPLRVPEGYVNFSLDAMRRATELATLKLTRDQLASKLRVNAIDAAMSVREGLDALTNLVEVCAITILLGVGDA